MIRGRAIPDVEDGLKPVRRRILHTLFEMDDGKFHKAANVVGHCMQYHPHGDASIRDALVTLANKELFIEKQGNFGNIFTGDAAPAPRYIDTRKKFSFTVHYLPKPRVKISKKTFKAQDYAVKKLKAGGVRVAQKSRLSGSCEPLVRWQFARREIAG
jgi:hypothetical protein